MDKPAFTFYSKSEYYSELVKRIKNTGADSRIALETMAFDPQLPEVGQILDELCAAAKRGAKVSLAVDAYIFLLGNKKQFGPLFFSRKLPTRLYGLFKIKNEYIKKLQAAGVRCIITNKPDRVFTSPIADRSHIKFGVVDDYLFVGGCNITTEKNLDIMVGWNDSKTAYWLYNFALSVQDNSGTRFLNGQDLAFDVDSKSELLIDSGKRRQSIIYQKALELIDQAEKEILITCQFFPNSLTAKHLVRAHERGVRVTILYNHPSKHAPPHNLLHHAVILRERARTPAILFKRQLPKSKNFLHAKLIATEKGAIVGSHNFVRAGVNLGTAEIALLRHDTEFARNALQAVTGLLK